MKAQHLLSAIAVAMLVASSAHGQIVSGFMTVTGAEMHWWAGVARDATARLYDVDEDTVVFKKLEQSKKYDQGTVTFRARKGKLIDLDKLYESIHATRLSGGTRSGLVSLEVTAIGAVVANQEQMILEVAGSAAHFVLAKDPENEGRDVFAELQAAAPHVVSVTGRLDGWAGRWPNMLRKRPAKPRRILVTGFETAEAQ